ncbi:MAG: sulfite exporter TauE/SafE family protein [Actinobacteria bacterium]|nr:MAG: sulfite exporter TauE/SafE family protein [Actinomycetota bacterium]
MTLLVVIVATVAFAATIQATMGFGFALVAVPIIAVADDPKVAVVAVTAIGVPMTLWNTIRWRVHLRVGAMGTVVGASLIGMPVGALILTRAPDRVLTFAIGIVVLGLTAWLWRGLQLPAGPRTEVAAGIASGALATSTGTNGPPLVIAFQATGMERDAFRATLAGCFFVQGVIALVLFWAGGLLTRHVGAAFVVGVPAIVAGTLGGERLSTQLHGHAFRVAVLTLLGLSGALAIVGAITSSG